MNPPTLTDTIAPPPDLAVGPPRTLSPLPPATNLSGILGTVEVLSEVEQAEMRTCEATIEKGWRTFVDVGLALTRIRDDRLFRTEFSSFEAYYRARWDFQHSKVYSLISAAQVFASLSGLNEVPLPDCESQLRPLFGLQPSQVQLAWHYVVAKSAGRRITAQRVRSAVHELGLSPHQSAAAPRERRPDKNEQRRLIRAAIGELLLLISQKASYDILTEKVEALHRSLEQCWDGEG